MCLIGVEIGQATLQGHSNWLSPFNKQARPKVFKNPFEPKRIGKAKAF